MQNYLLAFFALSAGLLNLFWKEKSKWFVFAILIGVATVSVWKEISASQAKRSTQEEQKLQDELRTRLFSELLSGYHKLDHLLFMVDLQGEKLPDGDISYDKASNYFPFFTINNTTVNNLRIHLVINADSTDIYLTHVEPAIPLSGEEKEAYEFNMQHIKIVSDTNHPFSKEVIAPHYTYEVSMPTSLPALRIPLLLPVFLQSMNKEKQVVFFEYELANPLTEKELSILSASLVENLSITYKAYVTDNTAIGDIALSDMQIDGGFRPHIFIKIMPGKIIQTGNKLRIPLIVADYPKLSFTEEVTL
jgi:hypothetical protein